MSSKEATVDPDEMMRQKKAAIRAKYEASSSTANNVPPPAFNPAYVEYQQNQEQSHQESQDQYQQEQFVDEDMESLEEMTKPKPSKVPPSNTFHPNHEFSGNSTTKPDDAFQQQEPDPHQQNHPETSTSNELDSTPPLPLPTTTELIQNQFQTVNAIPIATEVVPDEELANGQGETSNHETINGNGVNNGFGNSNNNNDDDEGGLKHKGKNKKLRLLLAAAIILAIAAIGGAVGVIMSNNSNENDDRGATGTDTNSPFDPSSSNSALSDIAEPIKCSISGVSGTTSDEPFFREPSCNGVASTAENQGKWYSLVGDGSCVTLSTCFLATEFDTRIRVFTEDNDNNRVCYAGNDDALGSDVTCPPDSLQSMLTFSTDVGVLYYIFLDGFGKGDNGNFMMSIDCASSCEAVPGVLQPSPLPIVGQTPEPTPDPTPQPVLLVNKKPSIPTPTLVRPVVPGGPNKPIVNPGLNPTVVDISTSPGPEEELFVSGSWQEIEKIDEQGACCTGKTLAFSSNTRALAVSSPWTDWGDIGNAGVINVYYRDFILTDGDNRKLQDDDDFTDEWLKVGASIHGQNPNERLGLNIAFSGDGKILVATNSTHVNTYRIFPKLWYEMPISDPPTVTSSGGKVALSADGNILAVSKYSSSTGTIKTYRLFQGLSGARWILFGGTITPSPSSSRIDSIALSGNGTVLAFGTSGRSAYAYYIPSTNDNWKKFATLSSSVYGFGDPVALSDDGKVLAVGERGNIKTYNLDGSSSFWETRAPDIPYFENGGGSIEAASLSLSADGSVLVLGNYDNDYNYELNGQMDIGQALVYRYDGDGLPWRQFGGDLSETTIATYFGHNVAVSGNGTELAVAASCSGGCTFIYRLE